MQNSVCSLPCLSAGLPVQVRDKALKVHDEIPKSDVGKEYYQQNLEREVTGDTHTYILF